MLKKYHIIILSLLISACSLQSEDRLGQVTELLNNEFPQTAQWQLSYFKEPVFKSKIAVLEAGNKSKPSIILIHGLGQLGMKDWFDVLPTLEENYHVIALDLPGFGLSINAKGRFHPTNYAQVVAAVSKHYANQKAIIIGHSMGGAVALRYTELYPQSVSQLILVDAAGLLEKSAFIKHIATFEFGDDLPLLVQQQIAKVNEFSSSFIEKNTQNNAITKFLQRNDYAWNWLVADSSNMNAALSLVEEDFSQAVEKITTPVDIIWGEKDNVAPLRTGKVLSKQMKNARLHIIEGAGHVPMKSNREQFIDTLNAALNTPINSQNNPISNEPSKGSLVCKGERDKIYTGHYDDIIIETCDNIQLINISTDNLLIKSSVVDIEGLSFDSNDNQIVFSGSVITITNADIIGKNTLFINSSRIDMAGVSIQAAGDAISVANGSRISASFSDINSPEYTGRVHGLFYLNNELLVGK
jgi:pimeloyl-ACP methyl ester carboxylesterase